MLNIFTNNSFWTFDTVVNAPILLIETLLYPWHIQNPDMFKRLTVFRSLSDLLQCLWKTVSGYNYFCKELLVRPF